MVTQKKHGIYQPIEQLKQAVILKTEKEEVRQVEAEQEQNKQN